MTIASKMDFLHYPAKEICTTILSCGPPKAGKTWTALQSMKYWIKVGMFERYVCILPTYRNEMSGSYKWMQQYKDRITVYESFHDEDIQDLITSQEKAREKLEKMGLSDDEIKAEMPRCFLFIDDATSQEDLFKSKIMVKVATENRHLFIHSWICCHAQRSVVPKKVRNNIQYVFLYPVKPGLLKQLWEDFIPSKFKEFRDFKKQFLPFWDEHVESEKYGCLLIAGREAYNPYCCHWFDKQENAKVKDNKFSESSNIRSLNDSSRKKDDVQSEILSEKQGKEEIERRTSRTGRKA